MIYEREWQERIWRYDTSSQKLFVWSPKHGWIERKIHTANGYFRACVGNKFVYLHRIIFYLAHGTWPQFVDHIDRNRTNNAIENLREVTNSQNMHNTTVSRVNLSGHKGVSFHKRHKRWCARIQVNGIVTAKWASSKEEAIALRQSFEAIHQSAIQLPSYMEKIQ